jgi:hypothetical protein
VAFAIPALNEAESLPALLRALAGRRVVVADNGSTDATAAVARAGGAEVVWAPRRGYGTAVQAAIHHLRARPPAVLVIVDADLADPVEEWPVLAGPIRRGEADLVLSDRTAKADPGAIPPLQRYGNALAARLVEAAIGHRYADFGPFRAIRWSSLERLGMCDPTWGWNVEMQVKAVRAGLRIQEVPLRTRPRAHGQSRVAPTLRDAARVGARIVWAVGWATRAPLAPGQGSAGQ